MSHVIEKNLADIEVGDWVILVDSGIRYAAEIRVERVTKTRIWLDEDLAFRRKDGHPVGIRKRHAKSFISTNASYVALARASSLRKAMRNLGEIFLYGNGLHEDVVLKMRTLADDIENHIEEWKAR